MLIVLVAALICILAVWLVMAETNPTSEQKQEESTSIATSSSSSRIASSSVRTRNLAPADLSSSTGDDTSPIAIDSADFELNLLKHIDRSFLAEAATCYSGGGSRNDRIEFSYQLAVESGDVSARNVKLVEAEFNDPATIRCMKQQLESVRILREGVEDGTREHGLRFSLRALEKFTRNGQEETDEASSDD